VQSAPIFVKRDMVRDGISWVVIPLFAAAVAGAAGYLLGSNLLYVAFVFLLLLAAFMAYFFRDPQRSIPTEDGIIVSPADGRVTRIQAVSHTDPHSPNVISIFLSPLDVHINRAPISGEILDVSYTKGRFLIATRDEASVVNEQNALTIRGERVTVVCRQIAGVLARRIVCWKRVGEDVTQGERFGLIKFSSRTDLVLPPEVEITVRVGERVRGGASVVGRVR